MCDTIIIPILLVYLYSISKSVNRKGTGINSCFENGVPERDVILQANMCIYFDIGILLF